MQQSVTAEDVFALYPSLSEYSSAHSSSTTDSIHMTSPQTQLYNAETKNNEVLVYKSNEIGDTSVPCSLNRIVYIRPGQECSICLEPIQRRSESRLLSCGHAYHSKCIFKAYALKMYVKWNCVFRCPICRQSAHVLSTDVGLRYNPGARGFNRLDELENFWNNQHTTILQACSNGYNHPVGTRKNCDICSICV